MATEPPPFITFRDASRASPDGTPKEPRVEVYQLALDLAAKVFTVVELTDSVERYYLRDTLDKKSTAIPLLIARGLATADMVERRDLYGEARKATTECRAILDIVEQRGTIEAGPVTEARAVASALATRLDELVIPPLRVR